MVLKVEWFEPNDGKRDHKTNEPKLRKNSKPVQTGIFLVKDDFDAFLE